MIKYNATNERIKRTYLVFLKEAKQLDEASLDGVAKAISRFEEYTECKEFKAFHFEQAIGFKKHLAKQLNVKTGKPLSKATLHATQRHLKSFFQWLSMQTGYKSRLNYADMEYFNLSEKDTRIATAKRQKAVPTIEQIKNVIANMPTNTLIEKRNRALMAFTILTGARDSAIASFKLKHIDLLSCSVQQDARDVKTKFSKTFATFFFPVSDDIKQIFIDWVELLKNELLYGLDDPLFPKTEVKPDENNRFTPMGLTKTHWSNASPIRGIFKQAFINNGLPYFNPHSFRNTLATLGQTMCKSPEEYKAWSQNLGHEKVLTTFTAYGDVQPQRQAEIFDYLSKPVVDKVSDVSELARALALEMQNQESVKVL